MWDVSKFLKFWFSSLLKCRTTVIFKLVIKSEYEKLHILKIIYFYEYVKNFAQSDNKIFFFFWWQSSRKCSVLARTKRIIVISVYISRLSRSHTMVRWKGILSYIRKLNIISYWHGNKAFVERKKTWKNETDRREKKIRPSTVSQQDFSSEARPWSSSLI